MPKSKVTKEQIDKLVEHIKLDQKKVSPAEKRLKVGTTFIKALKKMAKTPPPNRKTK